MEMIKCKTCDSEIATSAKICPNCGAKNKKPIWKRVWFWIVIALLTLGIIGGGSNNTPTNPSSLDNNDVTIAATSTTDNEIDGKLCEIISAEIGGQNYEGKPTVVITYKYTNNSNESESFDIAFMDTVFQNGIECSPDYSYEINEDNSHKEIRPGATIEVKKSYILNDTVTDLEIEITGFISWDNTVITKTIPISD